MKSLLAYSLVASLAVRADAGLSNDDAVGVGAANAAATNAAAVSSVAFSAVPISTARFSDRRDGAHNGVTRKITAGAVPGLLTSGPSARTPSLIVPTDRATPHMPADFSASLFAAGVDPSLTTHTGPNGAAMHDGSILVPKDRNGTIRRVTYRAEP